MLFDVDGTLTPPRQPLPRKMAAVLKHLTLPFHVAAGSDLRLISLQFFHPLWEFGFRGSFDAFLSNGAAHYRCSFSDEPKVVKLEEFDLRRHLGETDFAQLLQSVEGVLNRNEFCLPKPVHIIGERIVDRGSMLNVSPIGRPRDKVPRPAWHNRELFIKFDSQTGYRGRMLRVFNEQLSRLRKEKGLLVLLGGQTSFDFLIEGMDKTNAVRTLLAQGVERIVFFGDALFEGGNDSVITRLSAEWKSAYLDRLEVIPVRDWKETIALLKRGSWVASPDHQEGGSLDAPRTRDHQS